MVTAGGRQAAFFAGDRNTAPMWSSNSDTVYYWAVAGSGEQTFWAARIRRDPAPLVLSRDSLFTVVIKGSDLHPDGDRLVVVRDVPSATNPDGDGPDTERFWVVTNFFEKLKSLVPN